MPKSRLPTVLQVIALIALVILIIWVLLSGRSTIRSIFEKERGVRTATPAQQTPQPGQSQTPVGPQIKQPDTATPEPTFTLPPTDTLTPVPTNTMTPTLTPSPTPFNPPPVGQEEGNWSIVFHDEFDSSSLDTNKWNTCYWWGQDGGCTILTNNELQWYQADNVTMQDGALSLSAVQKQARGVGRSFNFTSGMISTGRDSDHKSSPPRFAFQYGYTEIRAWVPKGKGLLPAFWMLPITNRSNPEIDIMEILGNDPNTVEMHYHYVDANGVERNIGKGWTGENFSDGWHTFGFDWHPDHMIWYVDGVERYRFEEKAYIPAQPMYLLVNLAVGGNWPGQPDANTTFPTALKVKYVRVWQNNDLVALSPVEDAFVDNSHPETNYGGANTLHSDGDPTKITYLKYDASSLAGKRIASASLLLTTTSESGAGSPDNHGVFLLNDNSWQENQITFQNSPPVEGNPIGILTAPNKANSVYQILLDLNQIQPKIGSVFCLSIKALTGSDGLYMYSKDSDHYPGVQLILTFAPVS